MTWRTRFRLPSRNRQDIQHDIEEELATHLAMRIDALRRDGLSFTDARAQATRELGNVANVQGTMLSDGLALERRRLTSTLAAEVKQDARYAARLLWRSPGFALAAVATLTIGIGANTAVFSVINELLLAPVPVADPDALLRVHPGARSTSWVLVDALRQRAPAGIDVAAFATEVLPLGEPGAARRSIGEAVSSNYFAVLGVQAARGRGLDASNAGQAHVVLSDRTWRAHFDADPAIVGRRISIDYRPFEVVGVMPPRFRGLAPPGWVRDFWIPAESVPSLAARRADPTAARFEMIGRRPSGVGQAQAASAIRSATLAARQDEPRLPEAIASIELVPVSGLASFAGVRAMLPVFVFLGLTALLALLVLLIACANVAGLLVGRSAARRQEIGIRVALGAGRGRIVRQLLTESLLLAALGGFGGAILGAWLAGFAQVALSMLPFPLELHLTLDWRLLAYTTLLATGAAVAFGLAPARRAARTDVVSALRDDELSGRRQRFRRTLTFVQIAACSLLLALALLFGRSLLNIGSVDPGFTADGVLLAEVTLGATGQDANERRNEMFRQVQEAAERLPGVVSAGAAWAAPLTLSGREGFPVYRAEDDPSAPGRPVSANRLTPGWFATVRIPLRSGRDFRWDDRSGAPPVAVVNQTLAQRFWDGDALGRRLAFLDRRRQRREVTIVGIVGDSKYWTLGEDTDPTVYLPVLQGDVVSDDLVLHLRTTDPQGAARALAADVRRVAPSGFVEFRSMSDATAVATMPARVGAAVTGGFAAIAVLLATLGIYGLIAYTVSQRTKEIGVRKALGATTGDILRMVMRGTVTLTLFGLVAGLGAALLGGRAIGSLVVGVSPADPLAFSAAAILVASAVLLAGIGPALRASRLDPLRALRRD